MDNLSYISRAPFQRCIRAVQIQCQSVPLLALVIAFLLIFSTIAITPPKVHAASTGVIEGRVVNASQNKPLPNAMVKLFSAKGQSEQPRRTTKTNQDGFFRFSGLPTGGSYTYLAATLYDGVQYNTPQIHITQDDPNQDTAIRVYGTTKNDSAIRVTQASMTVLATDKKTQSVLVLETYNISNPTNRTFTPTTNGPKGQMGLLKFSLPSNSYDLQAIGELSSRQVIQVDKGFATDLPVRPGSNPVTFTYSVPYRDENGTLPISLDMAYPTASFRLLVPDNGPRVQSGDMTALQTTQIGGVTYNVFGTQGKSVGHVSMTLSNLPVNQWFFQQDNRWLWVGCAALALVLIGFAIWLSRNRDSTERSQPNPQREHLVQAIASLDRQYQAGKLDEESYKRERAIYKEALMTALISSSDTLTQ